MIQDFCRRIAYTPEKTGVISMEINSIQTLFRKITKKLARATLQGGLRPPEKAAVRSPILF